MSLHESYEQFLTFQITRFFLLGSDSFNSYHTDGKINSILEGEMIEAIFKNNIK